MRLARFLLLAAVALCALACEEEGGSNTAEFTVGAASYAWSSDDGGCQLRNQGSLLDCSVDVGAQPDEEDFSLSISAGFSALIEETTYVDVQESEFPDVEIGLWIEGCRYETPTGGAEQTVTVTRLRDESVRGSFEGTVECADSGASEPLSGMFYMLLTQ